MELELSLLKKTEGYVVRIILNSPQTANVIAKENMLLLRRYLEEAIAASECRVIVIEGTNGVFCKGLDFSSIAKMKEDTIPKDFTDPYKNVLKLMYKSPKPVIASIDGEVLAGGMGLVLAADIVIATARSSFGLSEVLFGLIPAYVLPFLLERVSFKKARFLILTSKTFNAKEAHELGIVDEIFEKDNLHRGLKEYIKRLLYSSPDALKLTKSYSDSLKTNNIDLYLEDAQKTLSTLLSNKQNIEAIKLYLEGELPGWGVVYKTKR